ncbi:hypothetical protein ACFXTO_004440 [Malus domestica]
MDTSDLINGPCGDSGVDLQGEPQTNNPPANNLYRPKVYVDIMVEKVVSMYGKITRQKQDEFGVRNKLPEVVTYSQPISRVGSRVHMTCLLQKSGKFRVVYLRKVIIMI